VARDVRLKLYAVSPSFAELKACLEGPVGLEWASYSDFLTGRPAEELQIGGGSFLWALRDCVIDTGHGQNAREALDFYRSIGIEVNRACDDGQVGPARPRRDSLMPPWRGGNTRRLMEKAPGYLADFLLFREFTAYPTSSWGSADLLELFRNLTRWRLAHSDQAPELDSSPPSRLDRYRLAILQFSGEVFRWLCVAIVISGIGAWGWAVIELIRRQTMTYLFVVAVAALGSAFAVLVLNLLVDVIAFHNRGPTALHEGYPLLVFFGVISWLNVVSDRSGRHRTSSVDIN
jgi:hypothetical protein